MVQPFAPAQAVGLGEQRGQQMRELELQRAVLHLVDRERAEADGLLGRERADVRPHFERAVARDPASGRGVRAAVAVDDRVLRRVRDVPTRYRENRDDTHGRGPMGAPGRATRRRECGPGQEQQPGERDRAERECDRRPVPTVQREQQADPAERQHAPRRHQHEEHEPVGRVASGVGRGLRGLDRRARGNRLGRHPRISSWLRNRPPGTSSRRLVVHGRARHLRRTRSEPRPR